MGQDRIGLRMDPGTDHKIYGLGRAKDEETNIPPSKSSQKFKLGSFPSNGTIWILKPIDMRTLVYTPISFKASGFLKPILLVETRQRRIEAWYMHMIGC